MTAPPASDRIVLRGLAVDCTIGFIDWERQVKQTVLIDLEMPVDVARAAVSDRVADTLDYKRVAKRVIAFVEASDFQLIETLAERVAAVILGEFDMPWVRVTLAKPGAIRGSREVGVVIERRRPERARLED
jgi:dihydroneopterin aldolase